jgi:hypothetical protein
MQPILGLRVAARLFFCVLLLTVSKHGPMKHQYSGTGASTRARNTPERTPMATRRATESTRPNSDGDESLAMADAMAASSGRKPMRGDDGRAMVVIIGGGGRGYRGFLVDVAQANFFSPSSPSLPLLSSPSSPSLTTSPVITPRHEKTIPSLPKESRSHSPSRQFLRGPIRGFSPIGHQSRLSLEVAPDDARLLYDSTGPRRRLRLSPRPTNHFERPLRFASSSVSSSDSTLS